MGALFRSFFSVFFLEKRRNKNGFFEGWWSPGGMEDGIGFGVDSGTLNLPGDSGEFSGGVGVVTVGVWGKRTPSESSFFDDCNISGGDGGGETCSVTVPELPPESSTVSDNTDDCNFFDL